MKKVFYIGLVIFVVGLIFLAADNSSGTGAAEYDYLRIHIRANSNDSDDQAVKYRVRDRVTQYLTQYLAQCTTRDAAYAALTNNLGGITNIAQSVLNENGFRYGAAALVRREYFPLRCYDGVTLPAGHYDALILELGDAQGDNWWCVVFPPLCFVNTDYANGDGVQYRSRLLEIIKEFFN